MKFVFFGTPEFAAIILEKLIKVGLLPQAVVCNPDKPIGRKKIVTPPPTKVLAEKHNISVLQPEKLLDVKSKLSDVDCQLFVVAAYAKIIPKEILEIPRLGTIGIHPSLLPKYRGATPIQTAILNGDEKTGTTLFLMDEKIDHGPILENRETPITNRNYKELEKELAELSANLLIETLPSIEEKIKNAKPQDESLATYTKKFSARGGSAEGGKTEDGYVASKDLEAAQSVGGKVAIEIDRKIRALNPEPGTWTLQNEKRMKILGAGLTPEGKLKLKKIQFESKKPQII